MKIKYFLAIFLMAGLLFACQQKQEDPSAQETQVEAKQDFEYLAEQFADLKVLRYQIPGFDQLSLQQKKYVYYLTQAGLAGRDIMYDQNYRHNLKIRRALEKVYQAFEGDKSTEDWKNFEIYLKRIWFSNGIHHHYANDKFMPGFSKDYLNWLLKETGAELSGEAFEVIFNEDDSNGDVASCTSIYAVRFGLAEYVSGLQAGTMDVLDQGLQGTFYQTLIEHICGLGIFHAKAAARLRGIKNA